VFSAAYLGRSLSIQSFFPDRDGPISPISGPDAGVAPFGSGTGGSDPPITYAPPAGTTRSSTDQVYTPIAAQSHSSAATFGSFAGATLKDPPHQLSNTSASSSSTQLPIRGAVSTGPDYSDSIADLKRQQEQAVNSYVQAPIQHLGSGVRPLPRAGVGPTELPPAYTPN
jgi:hypothetical protein